MTPGAAQESDDSRAVGPVMTWKVNRFSGRSSARRIGKPSSSSRMPDRPEAARPTTRPDGPRRVTSSRVEIGDLRASPPVPPSSDPAPSCARPTGDPPRRHPPTHHHQGEQPSPSRSARAWSPAAPREWQPCPTPVATASTAATAGRQRLRTIGLPREDARRRPDAAPPRRVPSHHALELEDGESGAQVPAVQPVVRGRHLERERRTDRRAGQARPPRWRRPASARLRRVRRRRAGHP